MRMCKACKEVFNANDMVDGYCKSCSTEEIIKNTEAKAKQYNENEKQTEDSFENDIPDKLFGFIIGFSAGFAGEIILISLLSFLFGETIAPSGAGWIIVPILVGLAGITKWNKIENIVPKNEDDNILSIGDFIIAISSSIFLGWLLFLKSNYELIEPQYSIGFKFLDNLLNFNRMQHETLLSYLVFIAFVLIAYKIIITIVGWLKYTSLAIKMDRKFQNIYNFHLPEQNKTNEIIMSIAMCTIFEEARKNQLTGDSLVYLLARFDNANSLNQYLQPLVDKDFFTWDTLKALYSAYNNYRAMNYMPLVSTLLTFEHLVEVPDKSKIEEFVSEYNRNPLVSFEAKI